MCIGAWGNPSPARGMVLDVNTLLCEQDDYHSQSGVVQTRRNTDASPATEAWRGGVATPRSVGWSRAALRAPGRHASRSGLGCVDPRRRRVTALSALWDGRARALLCGSHEAGHEMHHGWVEDA